MTAFGERLRGERRARGWPIEQLAAASGVSRAMISKVERGESSPTAVVLGKLSAALELSVSELLAPATTGNRPGSQAGAGAAAGPDGGQEPRGGAVRRAAGIPEWRDPDTGYLRRQVSTPRFPAAVTEVTLPPGARVPYPAGAYAFIAQLVWVLSGQLTLRDGSAEHALSTGDTFELGPPRPREFRNDSAEDCRYAVIVTRTATPLPGRLEAPPEGSADACPAASACRIYRRKRAKVKLSKLGAGSRPGTRPGGRCHRTARPAGPVWSNRHVLETPGEIDRLQQLLDRSAAAAGAHLRGIITDDRRLSATELCERLQGMRLLVVATVTSDGRPLAGPVDGYLLHGSFYFGSGRDSVRMRHLAARPAVSATYLAGEELAVTVHGRAELFDLSGPAGGELRQAMLDHYLPTQGPEFETWLDAGGSVAARIAADKMFTYAASG